MTVVDGVAAQQIALEEAAREFCFRWRKWAAGGDQRQGATAAAAAVPSVALSSTRTRHIRKRPAGAALDGDALMDVTTVEHPPGLRLDGDGAGEAVRLPMLASACPGFVCLVEKTAPAAVPLLSSAKSPTTVAGTLLKAGGGGDDIVDSDRGCYHVAIEPCHDKKVSDVGCGSLRVGQRV